MAEIESMWARIRRGDDEIAMHGRAARPPRPVGLPVVVVHGLVVSSRYVAPLVEELGALFDVRAPDLPGFGASPGGARPRSLADLADDLARFLDASEIERAGVVGTSFGCQIALELARRHPGRAARLVLHGPTGEPGATASRQIVRFLRDAAGEPPELAAVIARDFARAGPMRAAGALAISLAEPAEPRAAEVAEPALVIAGERDAISPPARAERLAAALPRGAARVLPGAGHAAVYTDAARLADVLAPFLAGWTEAPDDPDAGPVPAGAAPRVAAGGPGPRREPRREGAAPARAARARGPSPRPPRPRAAPPALDLRDRSALALEATARALAGGHPSARRAGGARWPGRRRGLSDFPGAEELAAFAISQYPLRTYPGLVFGPPVGAIAYLASALGAPYLPHAFSAARPPPGRALRDPERAGAWLRARAGALASREPGFELRLTLPPPGGRATVRALLREVPGAYLRALCDLVAPGGAIVIADCRLAWPSLDVGDGLGVQIGGPIEGGSARPRASALPWVRRRAARAVTAGGGIAGVNLRPAWAPAAEWGLEPSLVRALVAVARGVGLRPIVLRTSAPEALAALVAEIWADWYAREGRTPARLAAEMDIAPAPRWAERSGTVPLAAAHSSSRFARDFAALAESERFEAVAALAPTEERARALATLVLGRPCEAGAVRAGGRRPGADAARTPAEAARAPADAGAPAEAACAPLLPRMSADAMVAAARAAAAWADVEVLAPVPAPARGAGARRPRKAS